MWSSPKLQKSHACLRPNKGLWRCGKRAVALVVVLSLIVIVSLILVAFVAAMSMDRTASAGYSQSLAADQIGQGALRLITAELQAEMEKDALPDPTYPNKPLYTNVTSANILPQLIGTNSAMPNLIKISTATNFFRGTLRNGGLIASTNNTATPSKNGRYMDISRWNAAQLGTFPNTSSLPNWVVMTRGGYTGSGTFGATGNTLNNPAITNANYAVGRFAYAIYDVGGLLDITVAGHPSTLTAAQINQIKGTLAGADLSAVGITNVDALVSWRNAASAANASTYLAHITNFVSTNGFSKVAPGDTTFLSRQDLIKAAQQNIAGLTTNTLPNLTTFTREKNAPSWGPRATIGTPVGNTIDYAGLAKNLGTGTNFFAPFVRHTGENTIATFNLDAAPDSYQVVAGDPLISRRFPLDRIKWIGPSGPQNGGTTESIQACFGLLWDETTGVWQYVGATGSTEQTRIKLLSEIPPERREPNFFELLQAGILSGSLALTGQATTGPQVTLNSYFTIHEKSLPLHVLRIGAAILSQYDSSACPIVLEYTQSGQRWQATGVDNIPYLNMFTVLAGRETSSSLAPYLIFGLWNPHQGAVGSRPPIRLRVKGSITLANSYSAYPPSVIVYGYAVKGYALNLDATAMLSSGTSSGVGGFADPHALLPSDISPAPGLGTSAGLDWASLPAINGTVYAGYRLPDFLIDMTRKSVDALGNDLPLTASADLQKNAQNWQYLWSWVNTDSFAHPFNVWLEYQNPSGTWVPYNYHAGINDSNSSVTGFSKSPGFVTEFVGSGNQPTDATKTVPPWPLQPIDVAQATVAAISGIGGHWIFYFVKQQWEISDPRALRFNYTQSQSSNTTPAWTTFLNSSMWSTATDIAKQTYGRPGNQNAQQIFGPPWNPAGLARNNNASFVPGSTANTLPAFAAYKDPDGVRRIADSGLFEPNISNASPPTLAQGNPYALSTTRTSDRPIILNRPFYSVGELGYISRDYPWRTLDFFTAESADGGLLDLFTVDASNDSVVRGRINLNTQNVAALTAVMKDTLTISSELSPTPAVSGTNRMLANPASMAAKLITLTGTAPLVGRDEIATKFVSSLVASDFSGIDEQNIKSRREAVTRVLGDVAQTRTWNLLIDVVAQSGRYPLNASSTDQFVVEGERRFWLHLAIDRFTGEIVDQQLEPVSQ